MMGRLGRSRTRRNEPGESPLGKTLDTRASAQLPFKTSLDELRSPDGRQKLREQLSSAFPDSYAGSSSMLSSPYSMPSMAGNSSSSSVDTHAGVPKRLSTLAEQNRPIDVEQAIHLLTELKKTATPEQLVALHKALLPTRDSMISTTDSSPGQGHGQRASVIRQKSMLPPGLATRGGATNDPLQRQEDLAPVGKKDGGRRTERHLRVRSDDRLAALDLADDNAASLPTHRAATPDDEHYIGGFRPGTLRITNGAASPEPSLRPKPSVEALSLATSNEQIAIGRARAESLAKAENEARQERDLTDEMPKKRAQTFDGQTPHPLFSRPGPASRSASREHSQTRSREPSPAASRNHSRPRLYRPDPSPEPSHSRSPSITPLARSREPSLTRVLPKPIDVTHAKAFAPASRRASADTLLRRSIDSFTVRRSIDDGRVSPLDAPPRFAQRWSHRASQISQEYTTECEVATSPFEDRQNALAFASRLSTVLDGGDAEDTTAETPEAALLHLEGHAEQPEEVEEAAERRSLRATAANLNATARPPLKTFHTEPRPMPRKADSGYVSDASYQSVQREQPYDADAGASDSSMAPRCSQSDYVDHKPRVEPNIEVEQVQTPVKIQPSPVEAASPGRPDGARKHSSLLKLPALMRSTPAVSRTSFEPTSSAASSPQQSEFVPSSPADAKTIKPSKKLQKRMPEELRKQRRELREKEKQKQLSLALAGREGDKDTVTPTEIVSSPLPISEPPTPLTATPQFMSATKRDDGPPVELAGDFPLPAELDSGDLPAIPKRSASKKSKRRSRATTVVAANNATDTEDAAEQKQRKRSFSLGRKRSKSKRRSGSLTPKRKSKEVPAVPSIAALSAMWIENGSQDSLPLYSDHGSVSRTLGSNPYDISTDMFQRSNSSRPSLDGMQSPHQISTSLSRSRNGGLQGMDSSMASELARRKSRDVAMQRNEELYDRPRMATPRKRSQTEVPCARRSMPNSPVLEQRGTPGWDSKPVFQKSSIENLNQQPADRPHSIAESIPSLPELPADAEARSTKAAEYLARYRRGMDASPVLAESPSTVSSPGPSPMEAGFSNESVAEAVARAIEARKAKRAELIKQGQKADRLRPLGPRMNSNSSSSSGQVSLQLHPPPSPAARPYSDASASILIGVGSDRDEQESRPSSVQTPTAEGPTVWQRQAELWRQKRESATTSLKKPAQDNTEANAAQPVETPAPTVPPHSTPSTPLAREDLPAARRRRQSASEHADIYRELIGSVDDDAASHPDSNRASTQSAVTVTGRSTPEVAVVANAQLAKAYQAPITRMPRSPGGRVRTPSGSYHPYAPNHAAQAERSRASCLASLEGRSMRSTQSLDIQRRMYHQPNDTLESFVSRYGRALSPVPASEAGSIEGVMKGQQQQQASKPAQNANGPLIDRYAGGLQYGYQKGVGIHGSSGMRSSMVGKTPAALAGANQFSEHFGLDLGDVPVFVSRAS